MGAIELRTYFIPHTHTSRKVRRPPENPCYPPLQFIGTTLVYSVPVTQISHRTQVSEFELLLANVTFVESPCKVDRLLTSNLCSGRKRHPYILIHRQQTRARKVTISATGAMERCIEWESVNPGSAKGRAPSQYSHPGRVRRSRRTDSKCPHLLSQHNPQ